MKEISYPAFAYIFRRLPQGDSKLWKVGACRRANPTQNAVDALRKRLAGMGPLPLVLDDGCRTGWRLYAAWGIRGKGHRAAKNAVLVEAILLAEVAKSYKMWVAGNGPGTVPYIKLRSTDYAKDVDRAMVDQWIKNAERAARGIPEDAKIERLSADIVAMVNQRRRKRKRSKSK